MDFQRARSEKQKSVRREQIIEATLRLCTREPSEKITLASIANELNFSRANLYKYASTKEEIFLWILTSDLEKWVEKTYEKFNQYDHLDLKTFCNLWAEQMNENGRLLKLLSVLSSSLKNNVPEESLKIFEKDLLNSFTKLHIVIKKFIPDFSTNQLRLFDEYQICYAASLHPSIASDKEQRQEFKTVGLLSSVSLDFVQRFAKYLEIIILGLQANNLVNH